MRRVSESILSAAVSGLRQVEGGGTLDDVVDGLRGDAGGSAASDILFKYYRCKGWYDRLASAAFSAVGASSVPARVRRVVLVVLAQAFAQNGISAESAVNVAVGYLRGKGGRRAAGFLNAVLRRALELGASGDFAGGPVSEFPDAIRFRWEARGGVFRDLLLEGRPLMERTPPLTFTASPEVSDAELADIGCAPLSLPGLADGLRFFSTDDPARFFQAGFVERGLAQVRDPSTALFIALLEERGLDAWRDGLVLDLCSAPGGKALLLAERMRGGASLVASDISRRRLKRVEENFSRRVFECFAGVAAASAANPPFPAESADLTLIDAPCSNTGVFRRRPDALWRFSESNLRELTETQRRVLAASAPLVAPGGILVYSTCSLETEENDSMIAAFLEDHPDFEPLGDRLLVPSHEHDGGYAAMLRKKPR